jgi:hypothetical protein
MFSSAARLAAGENGLSCPGEACYLTDMLELTKVNDVVKRAAAAVLKPKAGVKRVFSERAADSDGQEALHITIVLKRGSLDNISGEMALNTLVGIGKALLEAKDERFPIIDYVTEEELASSDDAES